MAVRTALAVSAAVPPLSIKIRLYAGMNLIELSVFGSGIRVECIDEEARFLLTRVYCSLRRPIKHAQINYRITCEKTSNRFLIERNGSSSEIARGPGEFLYKFEKDLTIQTQKLRPDLYFVHAAVLQLNDRALALVAPSGHGKSTTTWGLLHHAFKYLSDELAPIDLTTLRVHPFPHALCLKSVPPDDYPLPEKTIFTERTAHVPTECIPSETTSDLTPLTAIFFLRFDGDICQPVLTPIRQPEAAVRLFTNALNPLAHSGEGLDAAIEIVSRIRCYELHSSNLHLTCELIKSTFLDSNSGRQNSFP